MLCGTKTLQVGSFVTLPQVMEVVRFGVVGLITASVYLTVAYLLSSVDALGSIKSSLIAFLIAVAANYCLHFFFTFNIDGEHRRAFPRFFLVVGVGLMTNLFFVWLFTAVLKVQPFLSQLGAMCIVVVFNFFFFKSWVFRGAIPTRS
jgi:putative flippase GtrA